MSRTPADGSASNGDGRSEVPGWRPAGREGRSRPWLARLMVIVVIVVFVLGFAMAALAMAQYG